MENTFDDNLTVNHSNKIILKYFQWVKYLLIYQGFQHLSAKDVEFRTVASYVWKVADMRKNPWCTKTALNLQPSDLSSFTSQISSTYQIIPSLS